MVLNSFFPSPVLDHQFRPFHKRPFQGHGSAFAEAASQSSLFINGSLIKGIVGY